jgi:hypothetical protein
MRKSFDVGKPSLQLLPYLKDAIGIVFGTQAFRNLFGIPKWALYISNWLHAKHTSIFGRLTR